MRIISVVARLALLGFSPALIECVPRLQDDPPASSVEPTIAPTAANFDAVPSDPKEQSVTTGAARDSRPPPAPHMGRSYGARTNAWWPRPEVLPDLAAWLRERHIRHWGRERCWTLHKPLGWRNECTCQPIALESPSHVALLACEWARTPDDLPGASNCFAVGRTVLYAVERDALRLVLDVPTSTWTMDEGCEHYGPHGLWLSKRVEGGDIVFGEPDDCNGALADFDGSHAEAQGPREARERRLARKAFTKVCAAIGRWRWRDGALVRVP